MAYLSEIRRVLANLFRDEEFLCGLHLAACCHALVLDEGVEILAFRVRNVEVAEKDVRDIVGLLPLEKEIGYGLDFVEPSLNEPFGVLLIAVVDVYGAELEVEPSGTELRHIRCPGKLDPVHEVVLRKDNLPHHAGEPHLVGVEDESHGFVATGSALDTVREYV